jgi:hypothetical protein
VADVPSELSFTPPKNKKKKVTTGKKAHLF